MEEGVGMKIARKLLLVVFAQVLLLQLAPLHVIAQENTASQERLTLSPAVSKPSLKAGTAHEDAIEVINDGTTDYTFTVYSAPFSVKDEAYDPDFVTINERTRSFEWVQFGQEVYALKAGERVKVPYTIAVPQNAAPGGHYSVIFAEAQPAKNSQIARKKRVGNLLYMTIEGDVKEAGYVEDVSLPLLYAKPPIITDIRMTNTGNVHFEANLQTTYRSIFGKQYLTYNQEVIIMPGTTRRVPMTWEKPPTFGVFRVQSKATFLGNTEQLETKYVILLPMPVRIAFAVVLLVGIAALVLRKKQQKKNTKSNDTTEKEADSVQTE